MVDRHVEVTNRSYGSRIGDSIKSVIVGVVLFIVSFPLLFWNEGRAVQTAKSLEEGQGLVVSIPAATPDKQNDMKLVHTTGEATTKDILKDPELGVSANAIRLVRGVEMFQWVEYQESETRQKVGGGEETTTTYTYKEEWADGLVDSSEFKKPAGHQNPRRLPYEDKELRAREVKLGGFVLPEVLSDQIDKHEALPVTEQHLAALPPPLRKKLKLDSGRFYLGANPDSPEIGDTRVGFQVVLPGTVSIVAQQTGGTFQPYQTKAGDKLAMLEMGVLGAQQMFTNAMEANVALTWILRFVGFLLMAVGLFTIMRPFAVMASVLPFLGDLLGMGLGLFAGAVAFALTFITVAIAWVVYRPVLGIALLVLGAGLVVGLKVLGSKKRNAAASAVTAQVKVAAR